VVDLRSRHKNCSGEFSGVPYDVRDVSHDRQEIALEAVRRFVEARLRADTRLVSCSAQDSIREDGPQDVRQLQGRSRRGGTALIDLVPGELGQIMTTASEYNWCDAMAALLA